MDEWHAAVLLFTKNDETAASERFRFYNLSGLALAEFKCMCYLELKSGCVSLTSVCGQEEVPIGLLKRNMRAMSQGNGSKFF